MGEEVNTASKEAVHNPFGEGFEEATSGNFIYWKTAVAGKDDGKKCIPIGGSIKGTLVAVDEEESKIPAKKGKMEKIYTILTEDNEEYRIGTRGVPFDTKMRSVLIGQHVGFLFAEEIPSKTTGYSDFKLIKIYPGQMNPDFGPATPVEQVQPTSSNGDVVPFK